MAGFFSYFLSYFVLPDYPIDGLSQAVFPLAVLLACGQPVALAPLFLGSLYRQLDLVQADYTRSLGRCDHISMAHSTFLLAYFFEHFRIIAPDPLVFEALGANFVPRPYNIPSPGIMGVGLCLLPVGSSVKAASGNDPVARTVINSVLIALPGWLPTLCNETAGLAVYRPDRFARQLGFDQGVPGPAPAMPSFVESQLRFMAGELSQILTQLGDLPIPGRDRVSSYTPEFRVFWRRNLDSFLTFVRGPRSQWAVIHAEPVNRVFPVEAAPVLPQAAPGRTRVRGPCVRTQPPPPPPAEPSQPSSSQAPATGERHRPKRIRNQRERDASTFVTYEPEAAAAAEEAAGEAEVDAPDAQPKRRRLDESSAVIGGTLPDEPSIVDLGGDPNTVSSESYSSPEESENVIVYSADRDPSPSHAAASEAREAPPSTDTRESVGQADVAAEPLNAAAAQLLREGEEDNVEGLPHAATGGLAAGQPGSSPTSTPSGSHQQSTSARIRAAGERAALRPEIQGLAAQLESTCQHLANLEASFARVLQHDAELAAASLNLADPDPDGLVFLDWQA
ncbi:hypothetical protein C3L33_22744, partial [Rhododendron williamsianum]